MSAETPVGEVGGWMQGNILAEWLFFVCIGIRGLCCQFDVASEKQW